MHKTTTCQTLVSLLHVLACYSYHQGVCSVVDSVIMTPMVCRTTYEAKFFVCLLYSSCVGSHRLVILCLEWVNISRWFFCCGYIVYLCSLAKDVCAAGLPHSHVCVSWFCLFAEEYSVHLCALGYSSLTGQSGNQMGFSVGTLLLACHYHSTNNPYSLYPSTLNAV